MRREHKLLGVSVLIAVAVFVFQAKTCFSAQEVAGKVNINTATIEQLALLPGIGTKIAEEIVNFASTEDLKKVKGVGDKKFEKVKEFIVTEGETTISVTKEK
jgi:competence protein ComEA